MAVQPPNVGASVAGGSRELRSFTYFAALARAGNYHHAARDLNISQPTLTKHIQSFENCLGTQQLIRHSRGGTFTPAGSRLLETLDDGYSFAIIFTPRPDTATREAGAGILRVQDTAFECAKLIVPIAVAEFRRRWPNAALEIREGNSVEIEEALLARRLELGILQDPPLIEELVVGATPL